MNTPNKDSISFRQEFYRKMTHLGALVIPCGYYYLGLARSEALYIMVPVTIMMILIDISRLRNWSLWNLLKPIISPIVREHEMKGDFTGAFYILSTATVVIAIYPKPIAVVSMAFIIVGDSAAALIGRKFGKHKIIRNKSLEGSIAFLGAAALVAWAAPEIPLSVGLIGALIATITEAVSIGIDDNTTVPLVSGLAMYLLSLESILPYLT